MESTKVWLIWVWALWSMAFVPSLATSRRSVGMLQWAKKHNFIVQTGLNAVVEYVVFWIPARRKKQIFYMVPPLQMIMYSISKSIKSHMYFQNDSFANKDQQKNHQNGESRTCREYLTTLNVKQGSGQWYDFLWQYMIVHRDGNTQTPFKHLERFV